MSGMNRFPRALTVALVVVLLALVSGGTWFYRVQERSLQRQVEGELAAIARLKADQIAAWRAGRLNEAAELTERPLLGRQIARWLANPRDDERESLLSEFRVLQRHNGYSDVLWEDENGRVRLSLSGRTRTHESTAQALAAALGDGQPVLTELHTEADDPRPQIDAVAPLFTGDGQARKPLGALILVTDAQQLLYPLIQSWPTPSRTAETLLVRRDGDHVLYLNDLRHRAGTALKLRIPVSQTDVPAVMAVLGKEGVVEGRDYRGVEVVSVLRAIPSSPWFMVAKVDTAEAFAAWRSRSALILLLLLGFVSAVGAGGLVIWQRNEKAHYRSLFQAETARRHSEDRHRITLMSVGDGVISTDGTGRVEVLNPAAETLTGWSDEEARGRPLEDVFHILNEETRAAVENPVARVLREGVVVGLANHTVLLARDGTERPIADSGAPIRGEEGSLTGVVLVFRDQTEERAAQKTLIVSESRYRRLFEAAQDGILILDADTGRIMDVNPFLEGLLGYSFDSLVGKEIWEIGLLKDVAASQAMLCTLQDVGYVRYDGLPLEARDGRRVEVEFVSNVYQIDGAKVIQCNIRDITDRKRAELALRHAHERLQCFVDANIVGVIVASPSGGVIEANDYYLRMIGYTREEFEQGMVNWRAITPPEWLAADEQAIEELLERGICTPYEKEYVRRDGTRVSAFLSDAILPGPEKHIVAFVLDITARKRLEAERLRLEAPLRQQQKLEALGTLAGGVAHEINNPITGIMNYAQLIADGAAPDSLVATQAREIIAETERVATIVRNLLQFSRQETQTHSPAHLADLVEQTLSLLRAVFRRDQITLTVNVPQDLPAVTCRSQQIQQVLMNLLTNARDALNERFPGYHANKTIQVRAMLLDQDGRHWLRLTVADQGNGIPGEIRERIFDPFFTTKPRDKGTGLGLAISHGIVQDHHGVLHFETEAGTGTQFHLDLPVEEE